ncbi:MAG: ribonuclease III [Desulfobacteraceae bacterium]|nr:ribonuclease III [Desulfobacteraceae bacterium]
MIDLHIHSTASDGSFSPLEILTLAQDVGVRAISLTDHDSIAGIKEILDNIPYFPMEFITGVEISCEPPLAFKGIGSVHLLGYGFSIYDKGLNQALKQAARAREERNPRIIEKLNALGFDISLAQVAQRFGAAQTGRPHIAQLMKEKGYVKSFREAFDKYLGKDKPAHVDKFNISCEEGIQIILDAGGLPVLAHPGLLEFKKSRGLEAFVDILTEFGLQGIEVFHTDHDPQKIKYLKDLALDRKLLITGGSDFHGGFNQGVKLGHGKDNLNVEYCVFRNLTQRLSIVRSRSRLDILENNIDYQFTDSSLLDNALCHRSYLNENPGSCSSDNERLEFLGDAVLGLCIGHILMEQSPSKKEGELSKLRSNLVSEPALADMARSIDLGRFIKLGKGEFFSGGQDKNSILSDAFEALIAAVYLDVGFEKTHGIVKRVFEDSIQRALFNFNTMDYKSSLQEYAQETFATTPQYTVVKEIGPDHDKTFEICLELVDLKATGIGKTKKAAEQNSAKNALELVHRQKL